MTSDTHIDAILDELRNRRGVDLREFRRETLRRRVQWRMARLGLQRAEDYLARLVGDAAECDRLVDTIAINVSEFFRDPIVFDQIADSLLPEVITRKRQSGNREIRIWSAGCAAGQEAYTMAILVREALQGEWDQWRVHIFGTDIDAAALEMARRSAYHPDALKNARLGLVERYFSLFQGMYELRPEMRELVRFSQHDLLKNEHIFPLESVFGTFDFVLCRNVLIYFSRDAQSGILHNLCRAVDRGGYLILGPAEHLVAEEARRFRPVDANHRIFCRKSRTEPHHPS